MKDFLDLQSSRKSLKGFEQDNDNQAAVERNESEWFGKDILEVD